MHLLPFVSFLLGDCGIDLPFLHVLDGGLWDPGGGFVYCVFIFYLFFLLSFFLVESRGEVGEKSMEYKKSVPFPSSFLFFLHPISLRFIYFVVFLGLFFSHIYIRNKITLNQDGKTRKQGEKQIQLI